MSLSVFLTTAGRSRPGCGRRSAYLMRCDLRVLGIACIEGVVASVLGDDREVRFFRKVSDGGLHAHDILGSCCLPGDDVHRPDVDIGHGRRKEDVYGLVEPHFDTAGCYIDVLRICGEGRKQRCDRKEKTG